MDWPRIVTVDRHGSFRKMLELPSRHAWLAVGLFACVYGLRTIDEAAFRIISAAPFVMNLPPESQYLYGSPLTFWLGSYYQHHGLDYAWAFATVNGLGLTLFFVSLYALLRRECHDDWSVAATILFTSPLLLIVLSWIGKSDAFLLGFYFLFTLSDSRVTQAILCGLMALCHRELAIILLCVDLCLQRRCWQAIGTGLLFGETAVYVYTQLLLSPAPVSRAIYAAGQLSQLWRIFWSHPALHLMATFGPFWVFALSRVFVKPVRALAFGVSFGLALLSYDFTRIFAIISAPLLLEISREVVAEAADTGAIRIGGRRVGIHLLWPLMLGQFQYTGMRMLLPQGVRMALKL